MRTPLDSWRTDQVVAILREAGRPMNSTEVSHSLPYMHAMECREQRGESCYHPRGDGIPLAGTIVHVYTRGHSSSTCATAHLERLRRAGIVEREKVGRRVMWSLTSDYLEAAKEANEIAAALLDQAGLADATGEDLTAARAYDGQIGATQMLDTISARVLVDQQVASLRARGVEVEWVTDPPRGDDDAAYAAAIELRDNGPIQYVRVELWQEAPLDAILRAFREARKFLVDPATAFADAPDGWALVRIGGAA